MRRAISEMVLAACLCPLVHTQSAAAAKPAQAKPEFEVASVKPSAQPGRGVIPVELLVIDHVEKTPTEN